MYIHIYIYILEYICVYKYIYTRYLHICINMHSTVNMYNIFVYIERQGNISVVCKCVNV